MLCSWFYKHIQHLVFIGLSIFIIPVWADTIIMGLNGETTKIEIVRNGKPIEKFSLFTHLQTGDVITVQEGNYAGKENSITLSNGITVTAAKPYRVENSEVVSTPLTDVMQGWWEILWNTDIWFVNTSTMGEKPLKVGLLEGTEVKLIAGQYPLHLAWYGGNSPYKVALYHQGTPVKESTWIHKDKITLTAFRFQAGQKYQVIVSDDSGNQIEGTLTVVTPAQYQAVLSDPQAQAIKQSQLSSQAKDALLAAWLANQKQGQWKLQVYQTVAEATRQNNYPAFLVEQGLRVGTLPVSSPKKPTSPK